MDTYHGVCPDNGAFIHQQSLRLLHCCLLFSIGVEHIKRLQSIQNAAARLVSGTRKFDHIMPVLKNLATCSQAHCVKKNKVAMLVHKCLNRRAPSYLADVHPCRHTTRTSTAPFCCRWSAVGPQDKYQHRPTWVPLLWTSYVERPASLSTYRQQIF